MVAGDSIGIAELLKNEMDTMAIELNLSLENINLDQLRDLAESYLHKIINESLDNK
jgi:hypothetical protein